MAVIVMTGGEAFVVDGEASELIDKLGGADGYVELDTQEGSVHVNPSNVGYVKDGEVVDPIRDTPGPVD